MAERALTSPIHVGTVNGQPVRFFKGEGANPSFPWHSCEDLYQALGLSRAVRRQLLRVTQERWAAELRTVATADGLVTIAPHYVVQGLLGAAAEMRTIGANAPPDIEREYVRAGVEALNKMTGDLPPMASFEFALAAYRNTNGIGGAE